MCLDFQARTPMTVYGKTAVKNLQILAFIQLALLFSRQLIEFRLSEFYEIIFLLVLWSAWAQLSPCLTQLYLFYCLYRALLLFVLFATRFQNELPVFGDDKRQNFIYFLKLITLTFYLIAQYIAFLAYREFRAIDVEKAYSSADDAERLPLNTSQTQRSIQHSQTQGVFAGRGVAIG